MSTSSLLSLLEANNIVWELVKKTFSAQQNIIVYKQRPTPDLSTCPIGKGFQMSWYSKKEWLRLNISYWYLVIVILS
jgi:hypothetical protein